jgi:hypothetical protein
MSCWAVAFLGEGILFAANPGGGAGGVAQSEWEPVWFAIFGSLAINGLNLLEGLKLRKTAPERSPDLKDPVYWITFLFNLFIAAGLAYAYVRSNQPLTPMVAINVGASAPVILRALANAIPSPPPGPAG